MDKLDQVIGRPIFACPVCPSQFTFRIALIGLAFPRPLRFARYLLGYPENARRVSQAKCSIYSITPPQLLSRHNILHACQMSLASVARVCPSVKANSLLLINNNFIRNQNQSYFGYTIPSNVHLESDRSVIYSLLKSVYLGLEVPNEPNRRATPGAWPISKNGGKRKIRGSLISSIPTARYFSSKAKSTSRTGLG